MLEASEPNLLPPQNFSCYKISKNIVAMSWQRVEKNTRGYYVYRSFNKEQPEKYAPLILSDSNTIQFIDTIKSNEAGYYTYAVVDVNTSYQLSKLSNIQRIELDEVLLPLVSNFKVGKIDGKVTLVWDDMRINNNQITGYHLYKKLVDNDGVTILDWIRVNTSKIPHDKNMYIDINYEGGNTVYYAIECVGMNDSIVSDRCLPLAYFEPKAIPASPSNMQVYQNGEQVSLVWNAPIDNDIKKIKVYRALSSAAPQLLIALDAKSNQYIDKDVKKGNTYFYMLVSEYSNGSESRNPESIGVKVQ
jgi:fibronectin type 3 domain-containing protein